ncbi:MAG: phosphotransferase [Alphaproteobacteria bacterium]|nr:phosphotransferase [Alphaproteobacteria bacterium]
MRRPDRSEEIDRFLIEHGYEGATRAMLAGDASFRRYERVTHAGHVMVLMDAPPPWENVSPFMHVTKLLQASGASVPEILAADENEGFLLLEDLGDGIFTKLLKTNPSQEHELYRGAIDALLTIQRTPHPALPPYDVAVYLRELGLFAEWFLPQIHGLERAKALREEWLSLWLPIIVNSGLEQSVVVHRDYHADNLLWLPERQSHARVGMLDYQDALLGDAAYDLVSLLEDARRDVSPDTVRVCYDHFVTQSGVDKTAFATRYAVLGAQRNAKIIGIFTRLCVRDGKPHYLDYLPRVWGHFMHDISHPTLTPIRQFVDTYVASEWRGAFKANPEIGGWA